MRKFWLVILVFFTSACTNVFALRDYDHAIQVALEQETSTFLNMNRDLFSYHLPVTIGRKMATPNSVMLNSHNQSILMSLDVVNILNQAYDTNDEASLRDLLKEDVAFYTHTATFLNNQNTSVDFRVSAAKLAERLVLLILQTEHFVFTSIHPEAVSPKILYDMLRVARSARIAKDVVMNVYSKREVIDFKAQNLNMFAQVAPESGTVIDMVKELDEDDFTDFDFNADEDDPASLNEAAIVE